jgi:hypothetical protein
VRTTQLLTGRQPNPNPRRIPTKCPCSFTESLAAPTPPYNSGRMHYVLVRRSCIFTFQDLSPILHLAPREVRVSRRGSRRRQQPSLSSQPHDPSGLSVRRPPRVMCRFGAKEASSYVDEPEGLGGGIVGTSRDSYLPIYPAETSLATRAVRSLPPCDV